MTTEELLQAGIRAARAGDNATASDLLMQVVRTDPHSELGWFWLGFCRATPEQREYCFRRVLAINPQNGEARRQMELLHKSTLSSQGMSPPAPQDTSAPTSHSQPVEPYKERLPGNKSVDAPRRAAKSASSGQRKKGGNTLLWAGLGLGLFVCVSIAVMFALAGMFAQRNMPAPTVPSPTSVPASPTPDYRALFESAPCKFEIPDQARVDCGFVIVPEDRSGDPVDTIRIALAIYRSTGNAPKPDPILFLAGGPGAEAISWSTGAYESVIAPLLGDRDFIVFDPRGVGSSEPALDCDEFGQTYLQDLEGRIPDAQRASYYEGALLGCKNNLVQMGAKLSAYTSMDMAADARDVVIALGYQQANLYAVSYGTRVAQFVMRDYPESVRSAILDSVVPVEVQLFSQGSAERDQVLRALFDACKSDPACSYAYPDLEAVYNQVFEDLNAQPLQLTVTIAENRKLEQSIDGYGFRNAVLWALRAPQTIPLAPQLIHRIRDGDHSTLMLSLAVPFLAFDSISMGSYISVSCHDQIFAMSMESLDRTIYDLCRLWDIKPPIPGENDPVHSATPTLIFAGRYDSTTPLSFAHQLAENFAHSHVVEIPNQGHAPSATGVSECPAIIISGFLHNPDAAPDLTCVRETQTIRFVVPYDANAPIVLEPVVVDQYQINSMIPVGWKKADFGFYNRNGFWGDHTQIGIQRAVIAESEWLAWLSTNFRGAQGFDRSAVKYDERVANGLTWSIYQTSSQGYPVEIAAAVHGSETLIVLLFSYADEHDALFDKVFLPVIDATTPGD